MSLLIHERLFACLCIELCVCSCELCVCPGQGFYPLCLLAQHWQQLQRLAPFGFHAAAAAAVRGEVVVHGPHALVHRPGLMAHLRGDRRRQRVNRVLFIGGLGSTDMGCNSTRTLSGGSPLPSSQLPFSQRGGTPPQIAPSPPAPLF